MHVLLASNKLFCFADLLVAERAQEPVLAAINTESDLQVRTLLKDVVQLLATHAARTPREAERWIDLLATVVSGSPRWLQPNAGMLGAHAPRSAGKRGRGRGARAAARRRSSGAPMQMMRACSFDARPRHVAVGGPSPGVSVPEGGQGGSGDWRQGDDDVDEDDPGFNEGVLSGGLGGVQVGESIS